MSSLGLLFLWQFFLQSASLATARVQTPMARLWMRHVGPPKDVQEMEANTWELQVLQTQKAII